MKLNVNRPVKENEKSFRKFCNSIRILYFSLISYPEIIFKENDELGQSSAFQEKTLNKRNLKHLCSIVILFIYLFLLFILAFVPVGM